ncbi:ADP-ribosylglycohydrolase family protein [Nocardia uniformis]|uniref:ADP-ribosylglycohydrolase family protein n=1 Tax=Nocardia uniformis TaxID=53432 RepID=A0A849C7L9_9NOCA|nr:ADP-ribosylglycohydrolase family protein [Nocardia uniformis]NNH74664.1 ADP-ribosylglycohydrolase family protein [Nocardia uniformis]
MSIDRRARAFTTLRGLSIGDAFGSCFATPANHPAPQSRSLPEGPWRWTDDTEMACSIVAILLRYGHIDQGALADSFAERWDIYRQYGPGTNRILRLLRQNRATWRELAPRVRHGQGSWGNGASMRVAPLGAFFADNLDRVVVEATASAQITHTHPEGVAGAVAVAVAAALAVSAPALSGYDLLDNIAAHTPPSMVRTAMAKSRALLQKPDVRTAARLLGSGARVSAPDTVPFCLWITAAYPDNYAEALWSTASVGGDVDTTCAIVGGILAARLGLDAIPDEWATRAEPLPGWVE